MEMALLLPPLVLQVAHGAVLGMCAIVGLRPYFHQLPGQLTNCLTYTEAPVAATGLTPMLLTSTPVVPMVIPTPTPAGLPLKPVVHYSTQMLTETQVMEAAMLVPQPEDPEMASGATASISLVRRTPVWSANSSVFPTTQPSKTLVSISPTMMISPSRPPVTMSPSP